MNPRLSLRNKATTGMALCKVPELSSLPSRIKIGCIIPRRTLGDAFLGMLSVCTEAGP